MVKVTPSRSNRDPSTNRLTYFQPAVKQHYYLASLLLMLPARLPLQQMQKINYTCTFPAAGAAREGARDVKVTQLSLMGQRERETNDHREVP